MSKRRGRRALAWFLAFCLVLALAVGGVVALLRHLDLGLPEADRCTVTIDGATASLDPEQTANAALIAAIAVERGLPARAATIALATAMQESKLRNIDYGDRDSIGLFQQRPSQGWGTVEQIMDPVYSTNTFYDALIAVDGYEDMEITVAAQEVQRSAYPDAYAQHEQMARLFASALTGWSPAALTCRVAGEVDTSQTVAELLERDLPSASAETAESITSLTLDGDPERSGWVLAHWAVATASLTGVQQVTWADLVWTRDDAWLPADDPAPDGTVVVH